MRKYWLHAYSNIMKAKSSAITLVVMFILSAFLLNTGLLVAMNYGAFFADLKQELHTSDAYFIMSEALYTDETAEFLKDNIHIEEMEVRNFLSLNAKMRFQDKDRDFSIGFNNMDSERTLSKWKYVGEHLPAEDMSVYVPDIFRSVGGYQLNDKIELSYTDTETGKTKTLTFTIKGYAEDIYFASTDTGLLSFYLTDSTYREVKEILAHPTHDAKVIFTNVDEIANVSKIESELHKLLNIGSSSFLAADSASMVFAIDIALIEMARCMMATMLSMMLVVFSLIIVAVCLLVVHFRIVNSIEDDLGKFGSLKSVGYTSRQIILSILLQFSLITGIGSITGIALSYPVLPAISTIFAQQSGLRWEQGFDAFISAATLLLLLAIVAFVSLLAARKIRKLTPVNALRGESLSRKSKRNHIQLEKTNGKLSFVLALKYIAQNLKQSIMVTIILASVTFIGVFGMIMFYNSTINTRTFAEFPGMEICNAVAVLNPELEQDTAVNTILEMENVRKAQYLDEVLVNIEDADVTAFLMESYDGKESRLAYEGHYPESSKEVALAGILAERLEKKVGDTIRITVNDTTEVYQIVGLTNGANMGGMNISMLQADYMAAYPDFRTQTLYIYLEPDTDAEAFIETLEDTLDKEMLLNTSNFDKLLADGMAAYQNIVALMGIVMFAITLLVIALVVYFVIGSSIIRRKRELGIQKALGYTTLQLMNQISIGFTIPIIFGSIIGSIGGAFYTNSLLSLSMKGMGVMRANFIIIPEWVLALGIGVIVFSYLLSLLVTWQIRKISAYRLVTE